MPSLEELPSIFILSVKIDDSYNLDPSHFSSISPIVGIDFDDDIIIQMRAIYYYYMPWERRESLTYFKIERL
jgi:hypothetical protein